MSPRPPSTFRAAHRSARAAFLPASVLALLATLVSAGCGDSMALVGGECAAPYVACGDQCVDLSNDPANCGQCGAACAAGAACNAGVCSAAASGSVPPPSGTAPSFGGGPEGGPAANGDAGVGSDGAPIDRDSAVGGGEDGPSSGEGGSPDGGPSEGGGDGSPGAGDGGGGGGEAGGGSDGSSGGDASPTDDGGSTGQDAGPTDDGGSTGQDASPTSDGGSTGPDTGSSDAAVADAAPSDACAPPYVSDDHCGTCFNRCNAPTDTCRLVSGSYSCVPFCDPPETRCGNTCKNLLTDGDNCGACGRVCASNICIEGVCQGAASGDVVYIGHDYATTPTRTAQARLLENAVLLAPKDPVRVLTYQRYASVSAVLRVNAILADAQARTGRTIVVTPTTRDESVLGATTTDYDVVLVHDQSTAPAGALAALGQAWARPLGDFTHRVGVLIVLDGATGRGDMPQLISQTGLLTISSHARAGSGELIELLAGLDGVGVGVVTPFAVRANTASFVAEPAGGSVSWVTRHQLSGTPNVVHKIAP